MYRGMEALKAEKYFDPHTAFTPSPTLERHSATPT